MKRYLVLIMFLLFLAGGILGRSDSIRASMNQEGIRYSFIQIQGGETLEDVARQYNNIHLSQEHYMQKLREMNSLTSDTLYPGCYIMVAYLPEE